MMIDACYDYVVFTGTGDDVELVGIPTRRLVRQFEKMGFAFAKVAGKNEGNDTVWELSDKDNGVRVTIEALP